MSERDERGRILDEDPRDLPERECDLTGDPVSTCDCADCYYERHGEPKPCGQCGGVGGHIEGCI